LSLIKSFIHKKIKKNKKKNKKICLKALVAYIDLIMVPFSEYRENFKKKKKRYKIAHTVDAQNIHVSLG